MYIERYRGSKFFHLTSKKANTNGSQQGNGLHRLVPGRDLSFRASLLDRNGATQHEEQCSSSDSSTIRSSLAAMGTHIRTPSLPAKKNGTGWGWKCSRRESKFDRTPHRRLEDIPSKYWLCYLLFLFSHQGGRFHLVDEQASNSRLSWPFVLRSITSNAEKNGHNNFAYDFVDFS